MDQRRRSVSPDLHTNDLQNAICLLATAVAAFKHAGKLEAEALFSKELYNLANGDAEVVEEVMKVATAAVEGKPAYQTAGFAHGKVQSALELLEDSVKVHINLARDDEKMRHQLQDKMLFHALIERPSDGEAQWFVTQYA